MTITVSELMPVTERLTSDLPWLTEAKYFHKVDSTQSRVTQWLPKTGEGAIVVLAETQTKGVGRNGRPWLSPAGGVWFTLALPLGRLSLAQAASFSIVAALQVAQSLKEVNNLECQIKWPNDILFEGKKLAGLLLTVTTKFKKSWLLLGVGINVNNDLPPDISSLATSIKLIRGQSQGRSRLIESILSGLWTGWKEFDRTGFGPYQKAFEARMAGLGQPVQINMGKKKIEGILAGVDPQGNLLLQSNGSTKTVPAGEIVGFPA